MELLTLISACAPMLAPTAMKAIVLEESRGHPYAIHDGTTSRALFPATKGEAIATARRLLAAGSRIDGGLAQINSDNWTWLGLDLEGVFDPCTNLAAAETVLLGAYTMAPYTLDAAISRYNSGDPRRGIANGYVGRVKGWMAKPPPHRHYEAPLLAPSAHADAPLTVRVRLPTGDDEPLEMQPTAPRPQNPPWRFVPALDGFGSG